MPKGPRPLKLIIDGQQHQADEIEIYDPRPPDVAGWPAPPKAHNLRLNGLRPILAKEPGSFHEIEFGAGSSRFRGTFRLVMTTHRAGGNQDCELWQSGAIHRL